MNKLTDEQILALAVNAIGHETCGVFAIDRGNYYALDGSALIAIGRSAIAAHEATLATDNNLPCTNSNDPRQPGSRYTPARNPMSLKDVRSLIADDSFAISFQSLGQYRTHLLKFIDEKIAKHLETNDNV